MVNMLLLALPQSQIQSPSDSRLKVLYPASMAFSFSTHDDRPIILGYKFELTLATRQEGVDSKRPLEQVRGLRKSLLARSSDGSSLRYVAPLPDRAGHFLHFHSANNSHYGNNCHMFECTHIPRRPGFLLLFPTTKCLGIELEVNL